MTSWYAKVEHRFRVIKRQFGHVKVRNCGLAAQKPGRDRNLLADLELLDRLEGRAAHRFAIDFATLQLHFQALECLGHRQAA
ncbi:hypothetical protein [Paucibacter sp. DJ2R-2]|uniref:hypothetical protein n=1 Tax=Paucibacter sp. DJ2R-2 TaxID=2893558 RepID=UPI0021E500CF|nr:hypothetical protein [Paucibacter sp. DJ2R-2]MCV2422859.1 hypothetical protein [Paucibacter sp. DJ4R-1]MCV2440755.1 hypothetical protein [Paucibacter sp. DJ2R-2]